MIMTTLKKLGTYSLIIFGTLVFAPSVDAQGLNASVDVGAGLRLGQASSTSSVNASVNAGVGTSARSTSTVATTTTATSTEEDAAEFDSYVQITLEQDENLSGVSSDDDSVSVRYRDRARLFGFIPMTVSAEAVVNADGSVEVSYPWYRFLAAYDSGSLKADIEASAGTIARADGGATLSTSTKTRIVDVVRSVMRSHYEANLEAQASTSREAE